jgi:hypothetical protein
MSMKENVGKRVELHPACDRWMRGDRFGEIVGLGHTREYVDTFTGEINKQRPYRVKLDKSGDTLRFHPTHVSILDDE